MPVASPRRSCCHHWQIAATPLRGGYPAECRHCHTQRTFPGIDDQLVLSRALLASLDRVIDTPGPLSDLNDDTAPLILAALALLAPAEAPPARGPASTGPQP